MWATRAESPVRLERPAHEGQDDANAAARQAQDLSALVTTALAAAAVLAERAAGSLQQTASAEQQIAETMKEIVASAQRVLEIVGGITISVAERCEGPSHVKAAFAELSRL